MKGGPLRRAYSKLGLALGSGVFSLVLLARAAAPHIELIEPYLNDRVLIHFNTEPYRAYTLQYTSAFVMTSNGITAVWTDLYFAPAFPFVGHYIVPDTRLAPVRFYRLKATPE